MRRQVCRIDRLESRISGLFAACDSLRRAAPHLADAICHLSILYIYFSLSLPLSQMRSCGCSRAAAAPPMHWSAPLASWKPVRLLAPPPRLDTTTAASLARLRAAPPLQRLATATTTWRQAACACTWTMRTYCTRRARPSTAVRYRGSNSFAGRTRYLRNATDVANVPTSISPSSSALATALRRGHAEASRLILGRQLTPRQPARARKASAQQLVYVSSGFQPASRRSAAASLQS